MTFKINMLTNFAIGLALSYSSLSFSKEIFDGQTYKILEKDAEVELMNRVKNTNWKEKLKFEKEQSDKWEATQTSYLPLSHENKIRYYVPFYTSNMEIKTQDGKLIYPKGFTFNPLSYSRLPNNLYILTPSTAKFFKGKISSLDQVIIANGNPFKVRETLDMPTFGLTDKVKDRLGIEKTPSIISQEGSRLMIKELSIDDLQEKFDEDHKKSLKK